MKKNIFINLNWNTPLENQEKAINEISTIVDLNPQALLQPLGKEYWENATKVLYKMGYPKIKEANINIKSFNPRFIYYRILLSKSRLQ